MAASPSPGALGSPQPPTKEMVEALNNPANLEALLMNLTAPDTRVIAQAEAIVKKYLKGPVCVPGLMQQVGG